LRDIGDNLAITALQEILEANDSYEDIDQAIPSLGNIGTERSIPINFRCQVILRTVERWTLLELLLNPRLLKEVGDFTSSIFTKFQYLAVCRMA
jgi:hypothetical protein